ncbi:MAG: hypothetical protein PHN74_00150 [Candidatus Pacebacteria bacterium]|nr:hypothetical protein [Candidatus Paceibacterota bacterium]
MKKSRKILVIVTMVVFIASIAASAYSVYLSRSNNKAVEGSHPILLSNASVPQKIANLIQIDKNIFSLKIPEGWEDQSPANTDFFQFLNPVGVVKPDLTGEIIEFVSVNKESLGGKKPSVYVSEFKKLLDSRYPQSKFVYSEDKIFIGDRPATYIETDNVIEGMNFKKFNVLIDGGNNKDIWVLNYNVWADNWNLNKDIIYQSAASFTDKTSSTTAQ